MSIVLYKKENFEGDRIVLGTEADGFLRFKDKTSSCVVNEGTWILYTKDGFKGSTSILPPGKYADPESMGLPDDSLSSLRPFPAPSRNSILIFQDFDFKGRMVHLTGTTTDLRVIGFNDKASSAIVLSGTWRLYADVDLKGATFDLPPGEYPRAGANDALSSAEPL